MKGVRIALIVILSLIILGLCVLLGYGLSGRYPLDRRTAGDSWRLVLEQELPSEEIRSIEIDYSKNSNDIRIYESDSDSILIREYVNYELRENEKTVISVSGGRLRVKGASRNSFFGFFVFSVGRWGYTEVYLPKAYSGELTLCTASGDITAETALSQEKLSMTTASGNVSVEEAGAETIKVTTASGDVRLDRISGNLQCDTASGNVSMEEAGAETIEVTTASGDVRLGRVSGNLKCGTASGYVKVEEVSAETIEVTTASGDVRIDRASGNLQCGTASGNITVKAGAGERDLSTASGDISVEGMNGRFSVNTLSGEVRISGESGQGDIETASGDVRLALEELAGSSSVTAASGEVQVRLPEDSAFSFQAESGSGDIDTFFDDALRFSKKGNNAEGVVNGNAAEITLKIKTASGDIRVVSR